MWVDPAAACRSDKGETTKALHQVWNDQKRGSIKEGCESGVERELLSGRQAEKLSVIWAKYVGDCPGRSK
jgi:hypothetical protein